MNRNIESDIGYVWLCQITRKMINSNLITEKQGKEINKLNAKSLGAEIIVNI